MACNNAGMAVSTIPVTQIGEPYFQKMGLKAINAADTVMKNQPIEAYYDIGQHIPQRFGSEKLTVPILSPPKMSALRFWSFSILFALIDGRCQVVC